MIKKSNLPKLPLQVKLDSSESLLNSLALPTAVLDENGAICFLNQSWQSLAHDLEIAPQSISEGANFLALCDVTGNEIFRGIPAFSDALHAVLHHEKDDLSLEFSLPFTRKYWFSARITRLSTLGESSVLVVLEDITRIKQLEDELTESKEKFAYLFDNSVIGKSITLPSGEITVNKAFCSMLGYTPEELQNHNFQEITYPEDRQESADAIESMISGTTDSCRMVKRYVHRNGSIVWADVSSSINRDADGKPLYFMTAVIDITERRLAEEKIVHSDAELKNAQSFAHIGSWIWDIKANRVEWSDEMYRIFGISKETFTGDLSDVLNQSIHPDDRARVDQSNLSVSQDKNPVPLEYRIIQPDGSIRFVWGEAGELVLDENGLPRLLKGFVQDITARKKAEENITLGFAALEAAANAIVITDRQGIISWANHAFEELTGFSTSEAIGKNPRELVKSGEQSSQFYENLWNTILSGRVWHNKVINRRKDGSFYTEEMTITPVRIGGDGITHFIAVKQDISDRIQREHESEVIASVVTALRNVQSRSLMIETILGQLLNLLAMDGAFYAAYDEASGDINVEFAAGEIGVPFKGLYMPSSQGIVRQVIDTGQAYVSSGSHEDGLFANLVLLPEDAQAVACVPIINQDKTLGAICAIRKSKICLDDLHLLNAIAEIAGSSIHRAALYEQTQQRLERIYVLRKIDQAINASLDINMTMNVILDQITRNLGMDAAAILLYNPSSKSLKFVNGHGFRTPALQYTDLRLGQGLAGRAAYERQIIHVSDISSQNEFFSKSSPMMEEHFVEYFGVPLISKGSVKGVLELFNRSQDKKDQAWFDFMETLAGQAAIAIDNIAMYDDLQHSNNELTLAYDATIEGWSRTLDLRDKETEGHTLRVTEITVRLARAIGINGEEMVHIRRGALLHDIGKMGIPDGILLKPGPLTPEEWVTMKKHPVYAYDLLSPITFLKPALDIPYCHHEKWDGSGYPRGLKGEQIPISARLFAIADVWDAIRSDRPYRPAWSQDDAIDYIREQSGAHFDPQLVEVFFQHYLAAEYPQSKPTVLIVDDEISVTRSLSRSLKDEFTVFTASSGEEALRILERSNATIVLTDQRMPNMSGVELLERVHHLKPDTVGILISGYSDVVALTAAINLANVRGFIPKPWDINTLRSKLDEAVTYYRSMTQGPSV